MTTIRVSQGGTPYGGLVTKVTAYRHVIGFSVRHIFQWHALKVAMQAERDARGVEHARFHGGANKNGYDNGPDAFRHTYGSALIVYRLIHDLHMDPERAMKLAWDGGLAHELDSRLTGVHNGYSSAMDVHNNALGIQLGVQQALNGVSAGVDPEQALQGAVINAISTGKAVVLDTTSSAPRPSSAADLAAPTHDAPHGVEPTGRPSYSYDFIPHEAAG